MWALIESGEVAETTSTNPAGRFHPDLVWVQYDGRTKVAAGWRYDGETFTPPPGESVDERRAAAIQRIDQAADTARASDRSTGAYLDAEYRIVQDALATWRGRTGDDDPVPDAIQAWADAEGIEPALAASQIAEAAAQADDRLLVIRQIRLAGKAAVRAAGDTADFASLVDTVLEQFAAIDAPAEGAGEPGAGDALGDPVAEEDAETAASDTPTEEDAETAASDTPAEEVAEEAAEEVATT